MSGVSDCVLVRMMGNVVCDQYSGECDGQMSKGKPGMIMTVCKIKKKEKEMFS